MRRCAVALRTFLVTLMISASACAPTLEPPPTHHVEQYTGGRTLADLDELAALREQADAAPDQLELQWRAGLAHMRASLRGHVDLRDHTERYLERTWRLDPTGAEVPAARVLARYLNMRSAVLDLDKLELQQQLYASLLEHGELDEARRFQFDSFAAACAALASYAEGDTLAALRELEALERTMDRWTRARPHDIDACTMAGNFELTFAGVIPIGVDRRLRRGIAYLEHQQDNWQELSPRARNTGVAPNVRSVFALQLAEALLADGDVAGAKRRYEDLLALPGQRDTHTRAQLLALAEHRLANLDRYAGARELLPPWPAGVTGCVACHATDATLPVDDLYVLPGGLR
jgi:hypothetical protein